jgi:hypothetical protein
LLAIILLSLSAANSYAAGVPTEIQCPETGENINDYRLMERGGGFWCWGLLNWFTSDYAIKQE